MQGAARHKISSLRTQEEVKKGKYRGFYIRRSRQQGLVCFHESCHMQKGTRCIITVRHSTSVAAAVETFTLYIPTSNAHTVPLQIRTNVCGV